MAKRHHKLSGGRVEAVPRSHQALARLQGLREARGLLLIELRHVVRDLAINIFVLLEDAEDGADGDAGVHVAAPVKGVEDADVAAALADHLGVELVFEVAEGRDGGVLLLGGEGAELARVPQGILQHLIGDHVELLLIFTLHVDVPLQAQEVPLLQRRAPHEAGDDLRRLTDGVHDQVELLIDQSALGQLDHVSCQRDAGLLTDIGEIIHVHLPRLRRLRDGLAPDLLPALLAAPAGPGGGQSRRCRPHGCGKARWCRNAARARCSRCRAASPWLRLGRGAQSAGWCCNESQARQRVLLKRHG
mmetsp:Transcript_56896/g.166617  ORF Transcript_56896/g.166617 Transcript_56896/m.166617 type:complete len:303 (-) Transcript_56896:34-942(-)